MAIVNPARVYELIHGEVIGPFRYARYIGPGAHAPGKRKNTSCLRSHRAVPACRWRCPNAILFYKTFIPRRSLAAHRLRWWRLTNRPVPVFSSEGTPEGGHQGQLAQQQIRQALAVVLGITELLLTPLGAANV